jgi:signal transduction histidine kinase
MTRSAGIGDTVRATWLPWLRARLTASARCLLVCVLALPGLCCGVLSALATASLRSGAKRYGLVAAVTPARALAEHRRRLVGQWTGTTIECPYGLRPLGLRRRVRWILDDPATRRDARWLLLEPVVGGLLAFPPLALLVDGIYGFYLCLSNGEPFRNGYIDWFPFHVHKGHTGPMTLMALVSVALIGFALWYAPKALSWYGQWVAVLLAPTATARLSSQVRRLTETRAEAMDAQAAELGRIERDLHDGAQARLVAMGMNLGAAAQLIDKHPEEARAMLLEARDASARALAELRDLVRGIRPPVLSDRGLGDAVRALALDCDLQVEVTADLPGRLEAPVESAAYFTIAEALANASKHANARQVRIDLQHRGNRLLMTVQDDGTGGADPSRGSGLRGVERRLAPFDGVLALNSPAGGPTLVSVEIPCALS